MDGGFSIAEKTPLKVEMFLHRIKVIRSTTTKLPHSIPELWIFFREGLEVQVFLLSPVCKSADDTVFDVFSHFKYSYVQLCQFPLQTSTHTA